MILPPTVDQNHRPSLRRSGFTLIELLVVVAIILALFGMLAAWGVGAWKANRIRTTHVAMASSLGMADLLTKQSLITPDHRLANFYWVQPHVAAPGAQPVCVCPGGGRQMSSAEFFAFLASNVSGTSMMLESLGSERYKASSVPASWTLPASGEMLVDVYEQDPAHSLPLLKDPSRTSAADFSLASDSNGYRLRSLFDAWGNELVYRFSTHQDYLDVADTETPAAPLNVRVREKIIRDEEATRERYAAMGVSPAPSAAVEYVRPAVAAYGHPHFMSAGPDGKWGAFVDGSPPLHNPLTDSSAARDADGRDNLYSVEWGR